MSEKTKYSIFIMEYYSVLKVKETHATTYINLEDVMLSEISQLPKDKYSIIPLMCSI